MSSTVGGVRVRVAADETGRVTITITTEATGEVTKIVVPLFVEIR